MISDESFPNEFDISNNSDNLRTKDNLPDPSKDITKLLNNLSNSSEFSLSVSGNEQSTSKDVFSSIESRKSNSSLAVLESQGNTENSSEISLNDNNSNNNNDKQKKKVKRYQHVKSKVKQYIEEFKAQEALLRSQRLSVRHCSLPENLSKYSKFSNETAVKQEQQQDDYNSTDSSKNESEILDNENKKNHDAFFKVLQDNENEIKQLKKLNKDLEKNLKEKSSQLTSLRSDADLIRFELLRLKEKENDRRNIINTSNIMNNGNRYLFPSAYNIPKINKNQTLKNSKATQTSCEPYNLYENYNISMISETNLLKIDFQQGQNKILESSFESYSNKNVNNLNKSNETPVSVRRRSTNSNQSPSKFELDDYKNKISDKLETTAPIIIISENEIDDDNIYLDDDNNDQIDSSSEFIENCNLLNKKNKKIYKRKKHNYFKNFKKFCSYSLVCCKNTSRKRNYENNSFYFQNNTDL